MRYACIARERGAYPVRLMCRLLGVSGAGFYAAQDREPSARARRDQTLRLQVRAVHTKSRRTYGAPRVHFEVRALSDSIPAVPPMAMHTWEELSAEERRYIRFARGTEHRRRELAERAAEELPATRLFTQPYWP
jgi:hypothetical protein